MPQWGKNKLPKSEDKFWYRNHEDSKQQQYKHTKVQTKNKTKQNKKQINKGDIYIGVFNLIL